VKLLTFARDLKRRRARERENAFVIEGVRAVEELLASPLRVRGVLVAPQLDGAPRGAALRSALQAQSGPRDFGVATVSEQEFRSAAETDSPQGVLAIADIPERSFEALQVGDGYRLLVLDGVQDPGNVGTILRTAAALGVQATVALPGTVDLWNAKVVRGSMGAHFRHVAFHAELDALRAHLAAFDIPLWATGAHGTPIDALLETLPAPDRLAIAVGNEGAGISSALFDAAERTVALPIRDVESLNVAVATGILLYAVRASSS
jgi:TrmH family RNA methyltransferase